MPPKRTVTTTTPAPMTDAQIKALIGQGVADALAKIKANKTSRNGDDNHDSRTGSRRTERAASKYCPRGKIKKLEIELWNLKVKESDKVEKYVGGLPDMIQGSVMASKPKTMQDAIEFATELCTPKCTKYKRNGHLAWDCRSQPAAANNQRNSVANQKGVTCYECGVQGHYKKDCLKLKNKNQGNQAGNSNAVARAYDVGTAWANLNSNVVMGTFLLNNCYPLIAFDTCADRSFVYTTFSSLIDIIPTTLDHGYDVELADAVIVCDKKIVRIPFGNEILIVRGDGSNNGHESRLNIISCTKTQKYLLKGCQVFLAHITMKKVEDKSEEKRLEDVPIIRDFPEVFSEDFPSIPPVRQVGFQIDLIPGAALAARAPYQLAPSEMKELSDQLQEIFDKGFIRPSSSPWELWSCLSKRRMDHSGCALITGN
ncbi:putative reverse transcriptase domain-containing protein [Tanacetum coccineum]|uniref:Reverse transcriptase domain-containing protein n=1 Tax=Tanacetum coccineum TaxID=301880 RepID=A0ABQ5BPS8_9ASTR